MRADRPLRRMPGYLLIAMSVVSVVLASNMAAVAEYCGSFTFSPLSDQGRGRHVERALARVHAADATTLDRHTGAATVVSVHPMLLVTASHVAPDATAKVSFPNVGDGRLYEAKVIARPNQSASVSLTPPPPASPRAHDFAVLLVSQAPTAGVSALEIWLDEIDKDEEHDLVGYARDMSSPVSGRGNLALHSECAWRLRQTVFNGDSGGAAVSRSGLLVGVVLDGREGGQFNDGAMGQATILPLSCVRNTILSAFDHAAPAGVGNVLDADRPTLVQKLKPPPSSGWIDNIGFARGLRDLMANQTLLKKMQSDGAVECPLFKSTMDRKLGFATAAQLIKLASKNGKEAGDTFKRIGDQQKTENAELAARLYASAVSTYQEYVAASYGLEQKFTALLPMLKERTPSLDVSQALLSRALTLANLAELTGDATTKTAAVAASALAVKISSASPKLGLAYATLGTSAFQAQDYQTAIEAYSAAMKKGFSAQWVKDDYVEAFRLRDNIVQPHIAKDYKALGAYRGIDDARLRELIMKGAFGG